jgi:hypothetical protein
MLEASSGSFSLLEVFWFFFLLEALNAIWCVNFLFIHPQSFQLKNPPTFHRVQIYAHRLKKPTAGVKKIEGGCAVVPT